MHHVDFGLGILDFGFEEGGMSEDGSLFFNPKSEI
jgi:hypothetical protein